MARDSCATDLNRFVSFFTEFTGSAFLLLFCLVPDKLEVIPVRAHQIELR